MIDSLETFKRVVNLSIGSQGGFSPVGSFTAPDDLTLRAVTFGAEPTFVLDEWLQVPDMILSADPSLTLPELGIAITEFTITSRLKLSWENLAFPLPKGSSLYYGFGAYAQGIQLINLMFS